MLENGTLQYNINIANTARSNIPVQTEHAQYIQQYKTRHVQHTTVAGIRQRNIVKSYVKTYRTGSQRYQVCNYHSNKTIPYVRRIIELETTEGKHTSTFDIIFLSLNRDYDHMWVCLYCKYHRLYPLPPPSQTCVAKSTGTSIKITFLLPCKKMIS